MLENRRLRIGPPLVLPASAVPASMIYRGPRRDRARYLQARLLRPVDDMVVLDPAALTPCFDRPAASSFGR